MSVLSDDALTLSRQHLQYRQCVINYKRIRRMVNGIHLA